MTKTALGSMSDWLARGIVMAANQDGIPPGTNPRLLYPDYLPSPHYTEKGETSMTNPLDENAPDLSFDYAKYKRESEETRRRIVMHQEELNKYAIAFVSALLAGKGGEALTLFSQQWAKANQVIPNIEALGEIMEIAGGKR
jgi:hypothetical protein